MVDTNEDPDADFEALERKRLSGRRMVLFGVPAVVVLVLGIIGVIALFGGDSADAKQGDADKIASVGAAAPADKKAPVSAAPVFCEAIDYLVNLNTGGPRATYLKLQVQFEVDGPATCDELEAVLPRINGDFQSFLRELRPEELSGSASNHRLKEELLVRVNRSSAETGVLDVHITEFLVQ
ncbi:MAG: flagellar basal body-associated protein FliL [Rhodothalassiaceae bacterium]